MRELQPGNWGRKQPVRRTENVPSFSVFSEFDRLFDEALNRRFGASLLGEMLSGQAQFYPAIDVNEGEAEIEITAELPGLDEKDVQVSVENNILTLSGEKKYEHEQQQDNEYRLERRFGSFLRAIPLPEGLDLDNVEASFKNGVLTVTLPKSAEYKNRVKRIPVSGGH